MEFLLAAHAGSAGRALEQMPAIGFAEFRHGIPKFLTIHN
jgi:hypothetical protein